MRSPWMPLLLAPLLLACDATPSARPAPMTAVRALGWDAPALRAPVEVTAPTVVLVHPPPSPPLVVPRGDLDSAVAAALSRVRVPEPSHVAALRAVAESLGVALVERTGPEVRLHDGRWRMQAVTLALPVTDGVVLVAPGHLPEAHRGPITPERLRRLLADFARRVAPRPPPAPTA